MLYNSLRFYSKNFQTHIMYCIIFTGIFKVSISIKVSCSKPQQGRNTECAFGQLFRRYNLGHTLLSSLLFYIFI